MTSTRGALLVWCLALPPRARPRHGHRERRSSLPGTRCFFRGLIRIGYYTHSPPPPRFSGKTMAQHWTRVYFLLSRTHPREITFYLYPPPALFSLIEVFTQDITRKLFTAETSETRCSL